MDQAWFYNGVALGRLVHFHHSDKRFCGCKENPRQFSFDPAKVTCPDCKLNMGEQKCT